MLARARRRRSAAALVALSVAGAIVVLGSLLGVGIVTEDLATRRALADLPDTERLVGLHRFAQDGFGDADADLVARDALRPVLEVTQALVAMRMYQPPRDPFRIIAIDDIERWTSVGSGRLPKPCTGTGPCEAIRIGPEPLPDGTGEVGTSVTMEGLRFDIVGVGSPAPDLPLQIVSPDGLALLVNGLGITESPDVRNVRRTQFWLAPIDPERVHSWTLDDLTARVDDMRRRLGPGGTFLITTPEAVINGVRARTQVAIGRLVFISSLIVGVLLAFAAFAAAIERSDVALEDRRLQAAGASRLGRLAFVAGEALLPAVGGAVLGELVAAGVVAAIAQNAGAPIGTVVGLALLQPVAIGLSFALVGLAMVAVILGISPATGRLLQPRILLAAIGPVAFVLLWQRITAGPSDPAAVARDATSPVSVLLPGAIGLAVILGSLALLPPLLRGLARISRRAPVGVRLAAISVAREPLRPAAVMTLLAFSVGAVVFGQSYSATLRQGATDQAAFQVGLDVKVQALGAERRFSTEVVPNLRDGAVGPDVTVVPMVRAPGETATNRTFTMVGIEGADLPRLTGWRPDFSPSTPAQLGSAIDLDGAWQLAGHPIPDGARDVRIDVGYSGEKITLTAVVEEANGSVRYLPLGELAGGPQTLTASLFDQSELPGLQPGEPSGWRVLGLLAANGGEAGGGGPRQGQRQEGDLTVRGLEGIIDPGTPIHLVVSGAGGQLVRPPARTDGLVLPALVSPDIQFDADASGVLDVLVGTSLRLQLHPVGVLARIPSIPDQDRVVVVDLAPLLLAMNAHDPGTGVASQVLLGTPSEARTAEVVEQLQTDEFPPLVVRSRPALEQAAATDPFAIGIVWGLAVGAIAGLLLSFVGVLLATAAELRDERGDLWDLEAQGTTPRALTWLVVLRTVAMCAAGTLTGVLVGIGLGWFVASSLGVAGGGGVPIPPLVLVAPWTSIVPVAAGMLLAIGTAVAIQARRHFGGASLADGAR